MNIAAYMNRIEYPLTLAMTPPIGGAYGFDSFLAWWFGAPITILSLLSFIFIIIKQKEFK